MILIVKNPRQYFFCLLNVWAWIPHRADQLWALGNLDGGEKNNSENMGDRGNRWQKSIIEKKTNSIRIMFLMGIGPHGSSLVLLFWHLCLAHIDANLLSPTPCGPQGAQPCGRSSASNTWVCSNRNCQITSLFTAWVHPTLSDARLWGKNFLVSDSPQVCDESVRFQKPSGI